MPRSTPTTATGEHVSRVIARLRAGVADPTTMVGGDEAWRATWTPDGPGTLRLRGRIGAVESTGFGPGGPWLVERVPALLGELDDPPPIEAHHSAVRAAQRDHGRLRIGRTEAPYHELLPTIIAQRITSLEAARQWRRLCLRLGQPAPGPHPTLRLPPAPDDLAGRPAWWFHPLGIEARRAEALRTVGRHAAHLHRLPVDRPADAVAWMLRLPGLGPWTAWTVAGTALGDPDAVAVGDYHLPHVVAHALAGEARGDDERMLELLEPYRGQRGRIVRWLLAAGWRAPARGPRRRILPMHRW